MATWRGHIAGSIGFLGLPIALAMLLGTGGYILDPPAAFEEAVRSFLRSSVSFMYFGTASAEAKILWVGALFSVSFLFALFPDTDFAGARGRSATWSAAVVYVAVAWLLTSQVRIPVERAAMVWLSAALFVSAVAAASSAEHRTWTHSIEAAIGFPLLTVGVPAFFFLGSSSAALFSSSAILGYLSHLQMDGMLGRSWRKMRRRIQPKKRRRCSPSCTDKP